MPKHIDKIWDIREADFPTGSNIEEKIKYVLRYAILAPSTHNSQPWKFLIKNNVCEVFVDGTRLLSQTDPTGRDLFVSFGCLAEHITIAGDYYGISSTIDFVYQPGEEIVLRILFSQSNPQKKLLSLLKVMTTRVNVRGFFKKQNIPEDIISSAGAMVKDYLGTSIVFINQPEQITQIARLTAQAIVDAHKVKGFRWELAKWMRPNLTRKRDGLVGYSLRIPWLLSFFVPLGIRFFNLGKILAKLNYVSMMSAPVIAVLGNSEDNPIAWFKVGRCFERVNLYLNMSGLRTSIYVAAIEIGNHREILRRLLGYDIRPQFLFALGYTERDYPHSPRQPLSEKMITI